MSKIKSSKRKSEIVKTEVKDRPLVFSFKHMSFQNDKFIIDDRDFNYYRTLFGRFKEANCLTCQQFKTNRSSTWKTHPIVWEETTEPEGFTHLPQQLQDEEPWQFSLSKNEHGRVHGLIIDDVFYIIWFDPNHNLYTK